MRPTESSVDGTPMVSVVVPCRNERDHIEAAVRSILDQEPPHGGFEVIIADGMSDDGTRESSIVLLKASLASRLQ
jgi:glycosyltransferase involved in cell wall biosynthesis